MIYNLSRLLIIISFFHGVFIYLGIPNIVYKFIITLLTLILFVILIILNKKYKRYSRIDNNITTFIKIYFFLILISGFVNKSDYISFLSYIIYFLPGVILYFLIRKNFFTQNQIIKIFNLFFALFAIQIFATIIKFFVWGTSEAVVGTIHFSAGSLNTIIPLIAISFLASLFFINKSKVIYVIAIIGFLFMAWTGEKRGIYFYLIIVGILFFFFYLRVNNLNILSRFKSLLLGFPFISILLAIVFYFGVRYSPTLNPDRKMGGRFDLEYVINYAQNYSTQTNEEGLGRGRVSGFQTVLSTIIAKDSRTILLGYGPDELIGLTNADNKNEKYGVASLLGVNGWSTALISTGFLGAISFTLFYLFALRKLLLFTTIERDLYWKSISFGTFMIFIVVLLDFFTYTKASFTSVPINILIFTLLSIIFNRNEAILKYN